MFADKYQSIFPRQPMMTKPMKTLELHPDFRKWNQPKIVEKEVKTARER